MNNLENENIGLMLHKLTKYETLQAGGSREKKDFYSQKAKYYRHKLSKLGIDNQNLDNISNVIHGGTIPNLTEFVKSQGLKKKLEDLAENAAKSNEEISRSVETARQKLTDTAGNYGTLLTEFVKTTRELLNYTSDLGKSAEVEALENLPDSDIKRALQEIPEEFRIAVYLADVEGFSYKEIADIVEVPAGTVMSRLHRGRKLLREKLADYAKELGYSTESKSKKGETR